MPDHHDITCPFCGLLCDNLVVNEQHQRLIVKQNSCPLADKGFAAASAAPDGQTRATIEGHSASFDDAISHAATVLKQAVSPLVSGLVTDVNGIRQALALAERCGAVVDHADSAALQATIGMVQTGRWISTTFAEIRNRADEIVIIGERIFELYPKLIERVLLPPVALQPERLEARKITLIGPWGAGQARAAGLDTETTTIIDVEKTALAEVLGALRARVNTRSLSLGSCHGATLQQLDDLAGRLRGAHYAAILWAGNELDPSDRDIIARCIAELCCELTVNTRCVGLALGGSRAEVTANQVCTWQTGYPLRVSFANGYPEYDAHRFDGQTLLAGGRCDVLVWIAGLSPQPAPPAAMVPTLVVGHPLMEFSVTPTVFIPTAIPGVDHRGHLYRSDNIVSLPLAKLRSMALPSAAEVLGKIRQAMT